MTLLISNTPNELTQLKQLYRDDDTILTTVPFLSSHSSTPYDNIIIDSRVSSAVIQHVTKTFTYTTIKIINLAD
jgi:hypothetical protein